MRHIYRLKEISVTFSVALDFNVYKPIKSISNISVSLAAIHAVRGFQRKVFLPFTQQKGL